MRPSVMFLCCGAVVMKLLSDCICVVEAGYAQQQQQKQQPQDNDNNNKQTTATTNDSCISSVVKTAEFIPY